jgi:ribosomal-protein-alanine N-acetyltransferase
LRLRGYQADDIDAMHALDVVCFEKPFRFTRSAMRRFAEVKKAQVIVAEERGELVGFVILHLEEDAEGRTGYIITLDVEPAQRRKGIAGILMRDVERQARMDGCAALVLHVYAGNEVAIRFYDRAGFLRSHRAEDFYGAGLDAWVYHKLLLPLNDQG